MVSPQKEDGFLSIANEIIDALIKINLSPYESRVLWFIIRKTYGFNKKTDWISLGQFTKHTGLDRRLVHRTLKRLSSLQMIVIHRDDKFRITYGFQKDYTRWKYTKKVKSVIQGDDKSIVSNGNNNKRQKRKVSSVEMTSVICRDDKVSSAQMTTKDTIQKTEDIYVHQSSKNGKCPYEKMVELYHEILPELTEVRKLTDKRKTQAKKIWLDKDMDQDLEKWRSYLDHVRKSKFLMGDIPGKSWQADFEWITNYSNFVKIIEGKYHR